MLKVVNLATFFLLKQSISSLSILLCHSILLHRAKSLTHSIRESIEPVSRISFLLCQNTAKDDGQVSKSSHQQKNTYWWHLTVPVWIHWTSTSAGSHTKTVYSVNASSIASLVECVKYFAGGYSEDTAWSVCNNISSEQCSVFNPYMTIISIFTWSFE